MGFKVGDTIVFHNDNGNLNPIFLGKHAVIIGDRSSEYNVRMLEDVFDTGGRSVREAGSTLYINKGIKPHYRIAHANHISQRPKEGV